MGLVIISQDLGGGIPRNWTFQPEPVPGAGVEGRGLLQR